MLTTSGSRDPDMRAVRFEKKAKPAARLFMFPHAGASAVAYHGWHTELPSPLELVAVQYPGRGGRSGEPLCRRLEALVADALQTVRAYGEVPFAFFGHSLGALVAFELTRALRRDGAPLPKALFVSAAGAPGGKRPSAAVFAHQLPDAALLQYLEDLGGMPSEILGQEQMMAFLLPVIRADLEAFETWDNLPEPPLPMPIVAFGGLDDAVVTEPRLEAWEQMTTTSFQLRMLSGDHFYLTRHRSAVVGDITDVLREAGFAV